MFGECTERLISDLDSAADAHEVRDMEVCVAAMCTYTFHHTSRTHNNATKLHATHAASCPSTPRRTTYCAIRHNTPAMHTSPHHIAPHYTTLHHMAPNHTTPHYRSALGPLRWTLSDALCSITTSNPYTILHQLLKPLLIPYERQNTAV